MSNPEVSFWEEVQRRRREERRRPGRTGFFILFRVGSGCLWVWGGLEGAKLSFPVWSSFSHGPKRLTFCFHVLGQVRKPWNFVGGLPEVLLPSLGRGRIPL